MPSKKKEANKIRAAFMTEWLSSWHTQALETREYIRPADWIVMALTMIEIVVDTQNLSPRDQESMTVSLIDEMQKRLLLKDKFAPSAA
jgi:hypothetical protein